MAISEIKGLRDDVPVKLWAPVHEVESEALTQLRKVSSLPWVHHHVAAMADCHVGKGATVGSVIAMKGAVCPAAVGVDIGCGMAAVRTSLMASDLPDDLKLLRHRIEKVVPVGFSSHEEIPKYAEKSSLWKGYKDLHWKVSDENEYLGKARKQMGTLGGGNHFIEVCLDTEQHVWIMLHSGSRNIGKTLAEIHIGIAAKLAHNEHIIDRDLAVFLAGTKEMDSYRRDLFWAQRYAAENRAVMLALVKDVVTHTFKDAHVKFDEPIECIHNYVAEEHHFGEDVMVTRKGAISARAGQMGIIPGSMGTKSYIVRGLGNPESFESASHGAGRRMSRGAAKRAFTLDDLVAQTAGVECRKDGAVIDEIPGAYKKIEDVMANQADLVEITAELKQVLCVKG
jgi:tRNA-splicing ligase RtcB